MCDDSAPSKTFPHCSHHTPTLFYSKKINCFVIVKFLNKISEFRVKFFSSMYTEEICQKMLTKLNLSASESISKNLLILSLFMTNSNYLIPNYSEIYHQGIT